MSKVVATTINMGVMIFNSEEEYWDYQFKLMASIFDNAFDGNECNKKESP